MWMTGVASRRLCIPRNKLCRAFERSSIWHPEDIPFHVGQPTHRRKIFGSGKALHKYILWITQQEDVFGRDERFNWIGIQTEQKGRMNFMSPPSNLYLVLRGLKKISIIKFISNLYHSLRPTLRFCELADGLSDWVHFDTKSDKSTFFLFLNVKILGFICLWFKIEFI